MLFYLGKMRISSGEIIQPHSRLVSQAIRVPDVHSGKVAYSAWTASSSATQVKMTAARADPAARSSTTSVVPGESSTFKSCARCADRLNNRSGASSWPLRHDANSLYVPTYSIYLPNSVPGQGMYLGHTKLSAVGYLDNLMYGGVGHHPEVRSQQTGPAIYQSATQ